MVHGRHVNQEASGKGDVTGDASALLGDGFFGNLDQNFLAFLEKVGNLGKLMRFLPAEAASATAATLTTAIVSRSKGALSVTGGAGGSADFGVRIDRAVATSLGIEQSLGFSLSFFEFGVFGFFFGDGLLVFEHLGGFGRDGFDRSRFGDR